MKDNINATESKISILILWAKNDLKKDSLNKLYYSYIYCYLN